VPESSEWLSSTSALALIGQRAGAVDDAAFDGSVAAARAYVERVRDDLFVIAGDPPVSTFTPRPDVLLGTAMLAHRLYERRSAPLGSAEYAEFGGPGTILRYDPDIARLIGIGTEGRFVVGGTLTAEAQAALAGVE
jgi:hypothetical protein